MPSSNTQRTLKALKDEGRVCGIVERWIPPGLRIDLFNFIDIITICPKYKVTVGVLILRRTLIRLWARAGTRQFCG